MCCLLLFVPPLLTAQRRPAPAPARTRKAVSHSKQHQRTCVGFPRPQRLISPAKEKRRISLAVFGRGEQRGWWTELAATSPPTSANAGHLATAHCAPSLRSGLDAFRGSRWAIYRWAWQPRAEVAASSPISLSFQVLALSGREYFSPLVAVANSRFWKL